MSTEFDDVRKRLGGVEYRITPMLPVMTCEIHLSQKIEVSAEFRGDFDNWLRQRFGKETHALSHSDGVVICSFRYYKAAYHKHMKQRIEMGLFGHGVR